MYCTRFIERSSVRMKTMFGRRPAAAGELCTHSDCTDWDCAARLAGGAAAPLQVKKRHSFAAALESPSPAPMAERRMAVAG